MVVKLIKTKRTSFIVDEVPDELREKMGIIFGKAIHLYAKRVATPANPKGVMQYSDYFSSQAIQVCKRDNITEERLVNDEERAIYQKLSTGKMLDDTDREYLRNNYLENEKPDNS